MSALLTVTVAIKKPERLQEYISQVPATMAPFDAKMLSRGKLKKMLNGERGHQVEAVFEFPSAEAIENWHASDAYQALIPLRNEVCDMTLAILESF